MIPGMLIDFLERASVGIGSTRSRDLVPSIHWLSGWRVEQNHEVVECLVAKGFTEGLDEAVRDNGRFALTAEVIGPHETYQFKGTCERTRPVEQADMPAHRACRQRFIDAIAKYYAGQFQEADVFARIGPPALVVRLRVREVYIQTPGPAAGKRLFPASGART
jgi:hypothetical protein